MCVCTHTRVSQNTELKVYVIKIMFDNVISLTWTTHLYTGARVCGHLVSFGPNIIINDSYDNLF